jgi:hypothetical protein
MDPNPNSPNSSQNGMMGPNMVKLNKDLVGMPHSSMSMPSLPGPNDPSRFRNNGVNGVPSAYPPNSSNYRYPYSFQVPTIGYKNYPNTTPAPAPSPMNNNPNQAYYAPMPNNYNPQPYMMQNQSPMPSANYAHYAPMSHMGKIQPMFPSKA